MYKIVLIIFLLSNQLFSQISTNDTIAYSVDLEKYVITAQHEPTHYKEAIHKVEIISEKDFLARGVSSLDQALSTSPVIRIRKDQIFGSTLQMRGIDANNVAILIDGVPIIGRLDGNIDLSQINLQTIERIEIIEGSLSSLYGSNAAGGVINLISNKSQIDRWAAQLNTQFETIGQQNYGSQIGYKSSGFTFNINANCLNYNQYPVDSLRLVEMIKTVDNSFITQSKYPLNPKQQKSYGGSIRFDADNEWSTMLKYSANDETLTDYGAIKRPQFNPYAEDDFYFTKRNDLSLNVKKNWKHSAIDLVSSLNHYSRIGQRKRIYIETNTFDNLLTTADTTEFKTIFNRGIFLHRFNDKFKTVSGIQYSIEQGIGDRILDQASIDSSSATFSELAPFLELKYKPNYNTQISISGRYSFHSIYGEKFTPSALLKYNFSDHVVGRFSYAQGYRSPSLKELYLDFVDINHNIKGNTELQPEISHDFQLTLDYEHSKKMEFSCNIFQTFIQNRIDLFEYELLKFQYENLNEYRVFGLQPTINFYQDNLNIVISGASTFWSTNINEMDAPSYGKFFDLNNTIQYSVQGFQLNLNHRHVGNQPIYRLNNGEVEVQRVKNYELFDFSANKMFFNNHLNITLGVNNILGITTTQIQGYNNQNHTVQGIRNISAGRSVFINCQYTL